VVCAAEFTRQHFCTVMFLINRRLHASCIARRRLRKSYRCVAIAARRHARDEGTAEHMPSRVLRFRRSSGLRDPCHCRQAQGDQQSCSPTREQMARCFLAKPRLRRATRDCASVYVVVQQDDLFLSRQINNRLPHGKNGLYCVMREDTLGGCANPNHPMEFCSSHEDPHRPFG